jgi:retron-type reverse transcriptase
VKIGLQHTFEEIISLDNLLLAWQEFLRGKRGRFDVQIFDVRLMDNLFDLHHDLSYHTYRHGGYQAFNISDPKPRLIHKATVRDRLLHHAVHRVLYTYFERLFVFNVYSCRLDKGTHKAVNRLYEFYYQVSQNSTKTCWALKGDIRKFFANIDQRILLDILRVHILDQNIIRLLQAIIGSFNSGQVGKGLPLGNLTSQLLANVYMNEFDQFVKHKLKVKHYIRYADDFVILSTSKEQLEWLAVEFRVFLSYSLKLELHPGKLLIKTMASGLDFLGWVNFIDHRVLRSATKRRMFKKMADNNIPAVVNSYLGLLSHGNTKKLQTLIDK